MGIFQNLTGWHALILLAVVLIFFGAAKLPRLAKSLGESARILKAEVREKPAEAERPAVDEQQAEPDARSSALVDRS